MAAGSDQPSVKLAVADYYLAMGRKDEAARLLEELAGSADMHVPAKVRLATLAAAQNERQRANQIVDDVLVRDAKSGSALELKARLLLADGKRDEALEKAKAAIAAEPQLVPAQYTLGMTYLAAGDPDQARKAFEETLKLNPRAAAAQMQLARIQLATGKAESSGQYAQDVLKAYPENPSARLVLVRSLLARGDAAAAERELTPLTQKYPNVSAVHATRGTLDLLKRDQPGARRAFARAVELDSHKRGRNARIGAARHRREETGRRAPARRRAAEAEPDQRRRPAAGRPDLRDDRRPGACGGLPEAGDRRVAQRAPGLRDARPAVCVAAEAGRGAGGSTRRSSRGSPSRWRRTRCWPCSITSTTS